MVEYSSFFFIHKSGNLCNCLEKQKLLTYFVNGFYIFKKGHKNWHLDKKLGMCRSQKLNPTIFSLIYLYRQVGGERMYEKARKGESIELSPRRISIFQFDVERSLEDRSSSLANIQFTLMFILNIHLELDFIRRIERKRNRFMLIYMP